MAVNCLPCISSWRSWTLETTSGETEWHFTDMTVRSRITETTSVYMFMIKTKTLTPTWNNIENDAIGHKRKPRGCMHFAGYKGPLRRLSRPHFVLTVITCTKKVLARFGRLITRAHCAFIEHCSIELRSERLNIQ